MEDVLSKIYEYIATYGMSVLAAAIIFFIGKWLAKLISELIEKGMLKAKLDAALAKFVKNLCYFALLIFIVVAVLEKLGMQTTSFIAVVGAAGLAVGLALQGSLANFASGVLMLIFKPFKIGDFVEIAGAKGTVKEIQIFNTVLAAPDNVRVIIPNAQVTGGNILNFSVNGTRRVDLVIGVSYEDDLKKAQQVIEQVLASDEKVLKDPASTVAVSELGDSSVNFVVRPWVKSENYWDTYFDITEKVKLALDKNGISIPYPQRDVHMIPKDA
ncbi:MAG: mechanosensitive ion channel [Planctomycetes bacterium]|nr:mechanosensitive ion channel [Planctomycetota bacterium]